jgi:hypothetical protein
MKMVRKPDYFPLLEFARNSRLLEDWRDLYTSYPTYSPIRTAKYWIVHRKANELANATKERQLERQKERIAAAAEANFEIVVVDGAVLLSVVIWLID